MLAVLRLLTAFHHYPGDFGYQKQIQAIRERWRGPAAVSKCSAETDAVNVL